MNDSRAVFVADLAVIVIGVVSAVVIGLLGRCHRVAGAARLAGVRGARRGRHRVRRGAAGRPARAPGLPRWAAVGGWRTAVFSRSLGLLMGGVFLTTWGASSITGWASFHADRLMSHQDPVTWAGYPGEADLWNRTLQNWQSEMLAVGSMAVFAAYLRQRGSTESEPVGASQVDDTGETG